MKETISLAHGNGGRLTAELIDKIFLPAFTNNYLAELQDGALLEDTGGRLVFTTDSYVVQPLFFPGGDIGRLAVCGTANDLAVMGARPLYLSAGFIIEEGFPVETLQRLVSSMKEALSLVGAQLVTGDTKVVEKGKADGIYINTAGLGLAQPASSFSARLIKPGDQIILSGTLGDHAVAVMRARQEYPLNLSVASDVAPLWPLVEAIFNVVGFKDIRLMRDPTRGGLATLLNDFCKTTGLSCVIEEACLPVKDEVRVLCELTGFDPLYLANEGKLVLVCDKSAGEALLRVMQSHPLGREAALIGEFIDDPKARLFCRSQVGGERIVDPLFYDMLPRIC